MAKLTGNPKGRPSGYTEELADRICEQVALSPRSLESICKDNPDFPDVYTVLRWRLKHEGFCAKYARAKEQQMQALAEQIRDVALEQPMIEIREPDGRIVRRVDAAGVQRNRLRVDTDKWLMSKLAPKTYGERLEQTVQGADGGPLEIIVRKVGG